MDGNSITKRTLDRLRAEFLEMPDLRVTVEQVERLCGVERSIGKAVLDALVDARFLCLKADGTYVRATEGRAPTSAEADPANAGRIRSAR